MEKFPDATNKLIVQSAASISPRQKVNRLKTLFDMGFRKEHWLVHPSIIPFLTPMDVREARVEEETVQHGLLAMTAPVNHNKLNQSKTIQIVHTILGNAYQDEQEVTIANQDFGNDASIIVGYHDKLKTQPGKNRVVMKDLYPNNDEQRQKVYCGLFPDHTDKFTQLLQSPEFQQLIKMDATTSNGQQLVAEYFAVDDVGVSKNKQTLFRPIMNYCVL
jgi:hypothetical protein